MRLSAHLSTYNFLLNLPLGLIYDHLHHTLRANTSDINIKTKKIVNNIKLQQSH